MKFVKTLFLIIALMFSIQAYAAHQLYAGWNQYSIWNKT